MSKTRSLTPPLSEAARHVVLPSGIVKTSWPSVKAECARLGIKFDPWQDGAGRAIFGRRADGSLACSIGGAMLSIPRQVGKTFFLGAVAFAVCMLNPGTLVIWTAHMLPTAGETFRAMQAMAKKPKVWRFIKKITVGSGDEAIEFMNGSRILFGARERGFGLGFTKVGMLVLDEGQRLSEKTMDDLVPTMNQAVDPLMFLVGTPPRPTDKGEEFKRRRREALSGESDDMVYIECSADPLVRVSKWKPGSVDWLALESANPSYPTRTPKTAVLRMRKQLTPESFQREGLGIWDDDTAGSRAISAQQWTDTGVDMRPDGDSSYGVAFSIDGERVSIAGAVVRGDETAHVELIDRGDGSGLAALADWFCEKDAEGVPRWRRSKAIVLGGSAGAGVLRTMLVQKRVPERRIRVVNTPQYLQACTMFDDEVDQGSVTHLASDGQSVLDTSISTVDKDKRGGWMSTVPDGDETPVEAVSLALWGARTGKRKSTDRPEGKRKAVIV